MDIQLGAGIHGSAMISNISRAVLDKKRVTWRQRVDVKGRREVGMPVEERRESRVDT